MVIIDGALPFRIGRPVRTSGPGLPLAFSYPSSRSGGLALASRPGHLLLSSLLGDSLSVDVHRPRPSPWECRWVFSRHVSLSVPRMIVIRRTPFLCVSSVFRAFLFPLSDIRESSVFHAGSTMHPGRR